MLHQQDPRLPLHEGQVRNYIHNMTTFFGGLIIGLINCWQIALLTLATGPFIVAAGGISNIFLHRLAENIQDAYAEAAATNFYSFEQGRIAAYRLFEMISHSNSSLNQDGSTLATMQGNIEFKNVYFSYLSRPKIPILSDFYQTVPARKTVALVGRNGSRKSSIIPLMERFYDPTLGEVILDGENIKHLKLEWLRSQIGQVTQEPALLSLSIKDNIAYGRSATFDQIEEYQMDCKKFLQFIKDKKKRIDLDQKEASLKWKQKLKTVAKAKADAEAKESKLKASTKHKRRSYSESDSGNEDNMYNIF
ncbi:ABC transporter B family member 20-like [Zingiber officinale]|uniref:ABC transporter B family member 20-like n=1 Tax=Zingiber officinale TaxID=94328 RepID=UPI001C4DA9B6|nr:ABC transporter B family member 20-like [Zingiber officinale]